MRLSYCVSCLLSLFIIHYICFKATETAQQLKKTAGVPFHSKGRGLVKKIDTTSKIYMYTQWPQKVFGWDKCMNVIALDSNNIKS